LPEAFRPTAFRTALHGPETWRSDVELCAWPQACELPMNGTLPVELIAVPAGYTRLCAWALWQGYLESAPACELMTSSPSVLAEPTFAPNDADLQSLPASTPSSTLLVPEQVGTDQTLRVQLLRARSASEESTVNTTGRRLSTLTMPLFLPRTHPLQYRWASAAVDVNLLMQPGMTQSVLTANMQFSAWLDLGLAVATPLLPLPNRQPSDHVLFAVDVRLLTGVNRWSAETRTVALMMLGMAPTPSLSHVGRVVEVDIARANSSIYFKWLQGNLASSFGADLIQTQAGASSVAEAYKLHPEAVLHDASDPSLCTITDDSASVQRQFCTTEVPWGSTIPSTGSWTLWALATSPGLQASAVATVHVGQMCSAPMDVAYATTLSCLEGTLIESGASCTTSCQAGYSSSVQRLLCSQGLLTPQQFACAEDSCLAPNVSHAAGNSCLEGDDLAPGGQCTTQCATGYTPSTAQLGCSRGRLSPSNFSCMESDCEAPEVIYAASPSCSGLIRVKSGSTCTPQCQDGYVAEPSLLQCTRGRFDPETFICEPGVNIDVGIVIASVPSTLLAGSLALVAAYCFRGTPKAVEEKETTDPLKEWWNCVKEVEPGICVFCGKQPEELETRYEDHGPATLFRSCLACAAILGFEVDEDEEEQDELPSVEELKVEIDSREGQQSGDNSTNDKEERGREERTSLPRPPPLTELGYRTSKGSISDAVKGLQMENFLQESTDNQSQEVEDGHSSRQDRPSLSETLSPAEGAQVVEPPSASARRSQRDRERMSLADWQDSPERLDHRSEPLFEGIEASRRSEGPRRRPREPRELHVDRSTHQEADERGASRQHFSTRQERKSRASEETAVGPRSRRYEEVSRRSRRDGTTQETETLQTTGTDWSADDFRQSVRQSRGGTRSSRRTGR